MMDFLIAAHGWIEALHIVSVIFWMAGMLMLPRFFAYHCEAAPGSQEDRNWIERERRLLRVIMNPAMIATWIFGLSLATMLRFEPGWLHLKLVLVFGLTFLHHLLARWRKAFARGENRRSGKFYRMINEVPSLAIVGIVFLVVLKPF